MPDWSRLSSWQALSRSLEACVLKLAQEETSDAGGEEIWCDSSQEKLDDCTTITIQRAKEGYHLDVSNHFYQNTGARDEDADTGPSVLDQSREDSVLFRGIFELPNDRHNAVSDLLWNAEMKRHVSQSKVFAHWVYSRVGVSDREFLLFASRNELVNVENYRTTVIAQVSVEPEAMQAAPAAADFPTEERFSPKDSSELGHVFPSGCVIEDTGTGQLRVTLIVQLDVGGWLRSVDFLGVLRRMFVADSLRECMIGIHGYFGEVPSYPMLVRDDSTPDGAAKGTPAAAGGRSRSPRVTLEEIAEELEEDESVYERESAGVQDEVPRVPAMEEVLAGVDEPAAAAAPAAATAVAPGFAPDRRLPSWMQFGAFTDEEWKEIRRKLRMHADECKEYSSDEKYREAYAGTEGGFQYKEGDEETVQMRSVAWAFVKRLGASIFDRKDLISISLPVELFDSRSFLERLADNWTLMPSLLQRAANESDPALRIALVAAFVVGGLRTSTAFRKPFNPILGETFEAEYADGTRVMCEQTSHHPPVSQWCVSPKDSSFLFYGSGAYTASFRANSVKASQTGECVVTFGDGSSVEYSLPVLRITGIFWGARTLHYTGQLLLKDTVNRLALRISFGTDGKSNGKLFSRMFSKKTPTDVLSGELVRLSESCSDFENPVGEILGTVSGSWLSNFEYNGKCLWSATRESDRPQWPEPIEHPLPSDARYRADLRYLLAGDLENSQRAKNVLEELQRRDAALRKAASKA